MKIYYPNLEAMFKGLNRECLDRPEFVSETRIGRAHELIDITAAAESTLEFQFMDSRINRISYDYAEKFYDFMMSGGTDAQEALKDYPNVAKFMAKPKSAELPANFNTFYGPRIVKQYNSIVSELKRSPTTRRAIMMILDANDLQLLDKDETLEFPCTIAFNFCIRGDKLIMTTMMRSQNLATVFQLDVYLQVRLLHKIAGELDIDVMNTEYHVHMVNAHLFERDFDYVRSFVA